VQLDSWSDLMILELSDLADAVAEFGRDSDAETLLLPDPEGDGGWGVGSPGQLAQLPRPTAGERRLSGARAVQPCEISWGQSEDCQSSH